MSLLLQKDSNIYKVISNTPKEVTVITLSVAAGVWLLLSSLRRKDTNAGLKTIPSPKGAFPYLGINISKL